MLGFSHMRIEFKFISFFDKMLLSRSKKIFSLYVPRRIKLTCLGPLVISEELCQSRTHVCQCFSFFLAKINI